MKKPKLTPTERKLLAELVIVHEVKIGVQKHEKKAHADLPLFAPTKLNLF